MIPIADTRQLEVNGVIELYEITYGAQTVRICNDESDTGYVSWGGNTYTCIPVLLQGFELSGSGKLPNPTISVSNVSKIVRLVFGSSDLIGATIKRITTLVKYLDNGSTPSSTAINMQIFYIDQLASEDSQQITYNLETPYSALGIKLPLQQVTKTKFPGVVN